MCEVQPEVVYTHHHADLNVDHRITHQAVMTACRPHPDAPVKEIFTFEVLSSTEWNTPGFDAFVPNVFIDITDYLEIKLLALSAYELEMRAPPHARSQENSRHLAYYRGNSVGLLAAEGMSLVRKLC